MTRRQTHEAGYSWRKEYVAQPPLQPWWEFKAGMTGFWLVCASLGALAAVLVR